MYNTINFGCTPKIKQDSCLKQQINCAVPSLRGGKEIHSHILASVPLLLWKWQRDLHAALQTAHSLLCKWLGDIVDHSVTFKETFASIQPGFQPVADCVLSSVLLPFSHVYFGPWLCKGGMLLQPLRNFSVPKHLPVTDTLYISFYDLFADYSSSPLEYKLPEGKNLFL